MVSHVPSCKRFYIVPHIILQRCSCVQYREAAPSLLIGLILCYKSLFSQTPVDGLLDLFQFYFTVSLPETMHVKATTSGA